MSKVMLYRISAVMVLALLSAAPVSGQANLTSSGFKENFDSMGLDGTSPPDGWSVFIIPGSSGTWLAQTGIREDQMSPEFFGIPSSGLTAILNPTTRNINGFNAATSAFPNDRALTTSPTGIAGNVLELQLTNKTGGPVSSLFISYDIRRFTVGVGGDDELPG